MMKYTMEKGKAGTSEDGESSVMVRPAGGPGGLF